MLEKLCYVPLVPSKNEKYQHVVGTKVTESTKRQLEEIAAADDRTVSYVIRELMLRGLALYQVDGLVKGDPPPGTRKTATKIVTHSAGKAQVQRDFDRGIQTVPVLKRKAK